MASNVGTHIKILADRSGSMESCVREAVEGYNSFCRDQAVVDPNATVGLLLFDDLMERPFPVSKISEAPKLDDQTYVPRGGTSILDAIGEAIDDIDAGESRLGDRIFLMVITDGMENASQKYAVKEGGISRLRQRIEEKQDSGYWTFAFIGTGHEPSIRRFTDALGIPAGNVKVIAVAGPVGTQISYAAASAGTQSYMASSELSSRSVFTPNP